MQGRFALFAKVVSATAAVWLIAGCQPPRVKSMESAQAATTSNPPRDFKNEPLDPYSWGGIAMASGGRDSRTTYGSLSADGNDGVNEVYLPTTPNANADLGDTKNIYLVPDPRSENKAAQYVGSHYIDNDGNDETSKASILLTSPPRADLVVKPTPAESSEPSSGE